MRTTKASTLLDALKEMPVSRALTRKVLYYQKWSRTPTVCRILSIQSDHFSGPGEITITITTGYEDIIIRRDNTVRVELWEK